MNGHSSMHSDVVGECFLSGDKWDLKLLSELFWNSPLTFNALFLSSVDIAHGL